MIPSCRGRRGLLAIRFTLLKAKLKALLGRVLDGSRTGTLELSMAGGDSFSSFMFPLLLEKKKRLCTALYSPNYKC